MAAGTRRHLPRSCSLTLPGDLVFAGVSRVWGGALAFLDVAGTGEVVARAYRITADQLADLVAQEARQPVGHAARARRGRARRVRVVYRVPRVLRVRGRPRSARRPAPLTPTTRRAVLEPAPPSAAYLRTILRGLGEATGWSPAERAEYLLRARGVQPRWSVDGLVELCADDQPGRRIRSTAESTRGGGKNAPRGTDRPTLEPVASRVMPTRRPVRQPDRRRPLEDEARRRAAGRSRGGGRPARWTGRTADWRPPGRAGAAAAGRARRTARRSPGRRTAPPADPPGRGAARRR